jgi:hypothetical protein
MVMNDYSTVLNDSEVTSIFGTLFGGMIGFAIGVFIVVSLIVAVFSIICYWKCYVKMGEPGWASLIPFYCNWVLCEHTWGKGVMMFTWLIPYVGTIFMMITHYKLFKHFGKSTVFSILGMFFTPITLAICAFDKSVYTD